VATRIPDVGNPWLDAGIVPYSTVRPPDNMYDLNNGYPQDKSYWQEWFPADLITESFPGQFRNWFYAILTMSTVLEKKAPFKVLHSYALLRDEHGQEMHKSKGNAIWSDDAAEKVGADVMRWMFARHNPVLNLNFGYGTAGDIKRTLLTLWNVYSFFVTYANIDKFNPAGRKINPGRLTTLDRWILSRVNSLIKQCDAFYDEYELMAIVKLVEVFFDDLSNWYVRRNRRRFWKSENDEDKNTAYHVLYESLVKLMRLISPVMPFLTEEMYQNLVGRVDKDAPQSIHLCDFPVCETALIDDDLEKEVAVVRKIVSLGRAARNKVNLKIRQPLSEIVVSTTDDDLVLSDDDRAIVLEELNIKKMDRVGRNSLDGMFEYRISPRFEQLGPKYGEKAGQVADSIRSLSQEDIQDLMKSKSLKKEIKGDRCEIVIDDVEVKRIEKTGWAIAADEELGVGICTEINEGLLNEGLARELIHKIQLMRKEADFDLTDRINVYFQTNEKLKKAIEQNLDYLKAETLAVDVSEGSMSGEVQKVLNINGIKANIALQRIKTTKT
jgi:isoleucyl-tRNA synthetase